MTQELSTAGEAIALLKLRSIWIPDKVVLHAISKWLNQGLLFRERYAKGELALRWCKWQRLKTLNDPIASRAYTECFAHYNRAFATEETGSGMLPFISDISNAELEKLNQDIVEMNNYRRTFVSEHFRSADQSHAGPIYCERHLWGQMEDDDDCVQSHFWSLLD